MLRPQGPQAPPPLRHESRHGQPPEAPPVSCLMRPTTRRKPWPTHAARGAAGCGPSTLRHPPPRSQHHHQPRPPLLKAPPCCGPGFAQAAATHRLRATSARIGLDCCAPFSRQASFTISASECCGLGRKAAGERKRGSWAWGVGGASCRAVRVARHPPRKNFGRRRGEQLRSVSPPKLLTGAPPCIVLARHVGRVWVVRFASQARGLEPVASWQASRAASGLIFLAALVWGDAAAGGRGGSRAGQASFVAGACRSRCCGRLVAVLRSNPGPPPPLAWLGCRLGRQ